MFWELHRIFPSSMSPSFKALRIRIAFLWGDIRDILIVGTLPFGALNGATGYLLTSCSFHPKPEILTKGKP